MGSSANSSEHRLIEPARKEAAQLAAVLGRSIPDSGSFPGYDIVREIHRGGQGVVYEAVQRSTDRSVAIKVLHEGAFAGPSLRARFEREVQILGRFRHPNIVAIHDSGTAGGRFYYVMDCISGKPLDEWIADFGSEPEDPSGPPGDPRLAATRRGARRSAKRTVGARRTDKPAIPSAKTQIDQTLRLFAKICEAVNAAHLRGVIHRDLKPSNIRVDADGEPYVLDFGLAKIEKLDDPSDEKTPAGRRCHSITQTGQFVGSLQWASPEQVEGRSHDIDVRTDVYSLGVVLYRLLTGNAPYPSSGSPREVFESILHAEPARPGRLNRAIDDEVETIVLKCLSKDRERRYQTAGDLARDIRRYLGGEAIEAKRDSGWYVFRKSLRRYRVPVAVAVVFMLLVTSSTVGLSILYQRAKESSRQATESRAESEAVTEFLDGMLASVDPGRLGREVLVRDILDEASDAIGGQFADRPKIEARLRHTMGATYQGLGDYAAADLHLRRAFDIRRQTLGPRHRDTLQSMSALAGLCALRARFDEAEELVEQGLELCRRALPEQDPLTLSMMTTQARVHENRSRHAEAKTLYEQVLASRLDQLGEQHPDTLRSMSNLAGWYNYQHRLEEAGELIGRAYEIQRREFGGDHPDTLRSMMNLAGLYQRLGRYDDAEALSLKNLELLRRELGEDHPDTLMCLRNLGLLYCNQERYREAEPLLALAVTYHRRNLPRGDEGLAEVLVRQGRCLLNLERYEEAETALVEAHEILRAAHGPRDERTLQAVRHLVGLYDAWEKPQEADEYRAMLLGPSSLPSEAVKPSRVSQDPRRIGRRGAGQRAWCVAVDCASWRGRDCQPPRSGGSSAGAWCGAGSAVCCGGRC